MALDSLPTIAGAALLLGASIAAWVLAGAFKLSARLNFRFAAILFASGAVAAPFPGVGDIAVLVVLAPASTALALGSLARFATRAPPLAASLGLAMALAAGLGAALTASPMLAAIPAALAACLIAGAALQDFAWVAAGAGLSLLALVFALLAEGAGPGVLLFAAAALLALSRSALAVEKHRKRDGRGLVSAVR